MDDIIKASIEGRRAAFSVYQITDQKMINKIDNYFEKLNTFAYHYDDINEFEKDFANSELSKEYTDLFIEISNKYGVSNSDTSLADEIKDDVARGVRREVKQEAYDKVRDIPVVGEALNIKQHVDFFSRFKKKKN